MSFYSIRSNKIMNFREYLFMFINEPNKIGELVRSIYYGTSKYAVGEFQDKVQNIITEVSKTPDDLMKMAQEYMSNPENIKNMMPQMINRQQEFFNSLNRIYLSYLNIKGLLETNSNEDVFATQYKMNEIPISEKDKTMTKIISPPTATECINCSSSEYTEIFRQIVAIDFLNNMIKYATYFECNKCNKIVLEGL